MGVLDRVNRWLDRLAKAEEADLEARTRPVESVRPRGRFYGGDGTIHGTQHLDIEVDPRTGRVLGVWYRCQMLAFEQHDWTPRSGVGIGQGAKITGVEVLDDGS